MSNDQKLKPDPEFQDLLPPVSSAAHDQLESQLKKYGCTTPVYVWNCMILDGYTRYEICQKHHIPVSFQNLSFQNRVEAIAWVCSTQLKRQDLTSETRKYLIGKRFEAEKTLGCKYIEQKRLGAGFLQPAFQNDQPCGNRTAKRLGAEYHLAYATVSKYGAYTRAIDLIRQKAPDIVPHILLGRIRISHENLVILSKCSESKIRNKLGPFVKNTSGSSNVKRPMSAKGMTLPTTTVKDMPAYDPDAELQRLTLTIPSWQSSIDRVHSTANLGQCSRFARHNLSTALHQLRHSVNAMLSDIEEELS